MPEATVGLLRVILTANTAEFDSAMKRTSSAAAAWSKDLKSIGQQATQLGSALTRTLTVPLLGLGVGAAKLAIDFESSFAGVRKTVEATEPEFAALAQGLRDMAKEIPANVNELNAVAEAAGQLGIKKDDILTFTRTMADLGVTTNLTADQAATATAQIQNIFGAAGKDVDRFGATLVALGNAGASTEKDIIEMGLRIAGAGHTVGLTQDQVLSFASALSSVGINAEAGGSAISRTFLKINDAVAGGGAALDEFARVAGMTSEQFKQAFEKDAAGATVTFIEGLKRLKESGENVNATLEGLVGKNIIIKDTLLRASGAGQLLREQLALGNKAWQENTALVNEARERYKTTESQLTILWNRVKDVGITLGNALLPTINLTIQALGNLLPVIDALSRAFSGLPQWVQATAVGFGLVTAAVGPLLWVFGQLSTSAALLIAQFTTKGLVMRGLTALFPALTTATAAQAAANTTTATTATAAAGGLTAMRAAVVGLTQALAPLVVVGGSAILVYRALAAATDLNRESNERASMAANEQARRYAMMAQASKIAGTSIHDYATAVAIVIEHHRKLAEVQRDFVGPENLGEWQGPLQQIASGASNASARLSEFQRAVAELTVEQRANIEAAKKLGDSNKKIAEDLGIAEPVIKLYLDSLKGLGKTSEQVAEGPFKKLRTRIIEVNAQMIAAAKEGPLAYQIALEEMGDALIEVGKRAKMFGEELPESLQLAVNIVTNKEAAKKEVERLADSMHFWFQNRITNVQLISTLDLTKMFVPLKGAAISALPTSGEWANAWGQMKVGLTNVLSNLPDLFVQAFTGGGGLVGAMKALGVQLADALMTPLIARVKDLLSQKLTGAIGSGAAGAGGLGGSALIGLGITGVVFAAVFAMESARKKAQEYREALSRTKFELLDLRNAIGAAAMAFPALNDEFNRLFNGPTTEASLKRMGQILEEMQQKVAKTNDEFADLANELLAVGGRLPDALRPAIQQLITLGVLSKDNIALFQQLTDGQQVDWKKMQEAGERYGDWLGGELGKNFQQLRLGDVAKQMINDFDLMKRGGAEVGSILFGMKEEIVQLIKNSIKFGTTIPENMRPWIEELERAGLLVDETGEALNYDLGALRFGQPIETEVERITKAFERFIEQLDLVADKLANLPQPNVTVPNVPNPGFGDTDQWRPVPYARGGLVTHPTLALLGERGPELVTPLHRYANPRAMPIPYLPGGIMTDTDPRLWETPDRDNREGFREALREMREDLKVWLETFSDSLAVTMRDAAMGAV